jgi:hypothetical protein
MTQPGEGQGEEHDLSGQDMKEDDRPVLEALVVCQKPRQKGANVIYKDEVVVVVMPDPGKKETLNRKKICRSREESSACLRRIPKTPEADAEGSFSAGHRLRRNRGTQTRQGRGDNDDQMSSGRSCSGAESDPALDPPSSLLRQGQLFLTSRLRKIRLFLWVRQETDHL